LVNFPPKQILISSFSSSSQNLNPRWLKPFWAPDCKFHFRERERKRESERMTTRIAPGVGANLLGQHSAERNQDATAYVGNLDAQVFFTS